jgi:hypothetical protein
MRAPDIGWRCPMVELQWLFQSNRWDAGTGHRGGGAPRRSSPLSRENWRCQTTMVTGQSGDPNLFQINFHHFNLVELLVSFPKSPRSSKLEFRARSYARNTKGCCFCPWHRLGVAVPCPVHTRKGGATLYNGCNLATS